MMGERVASKLAARTAASIYPGMPWAWHRGLLLYLITPCPPRPAVSPRHGVPPLHPLMPTSFERWTIW